MKNRLRADGRRSDKKSTKISEICGQLKGFPQITQINADQIYF